MKESRRTLEITPTQDEAIKPSELIQITGHQQLSLNARRAITLLWHTAHRQGIEEGKDYTIELAELRPDSHKGSEMIEEAILALMQTVLIVKLSGGKTRRVQFLGGNDIDDPDRPAGVLTYSFDKRLVEILRDSSIWGRIALPVLMAFSSKYAVSLYENSSQLINLSKKFAEDYALDDFRTMLGVEDGKYPAFGALNKHVIKPAVDEINALAPFNVTIVPTKTGKKVTGVRMGWWRKSEEELREAYAEAQRPRVGRRARISGRVEHVAPMPSVESMSRKARLEMRRNSPNSSLLEDE
ncbi:hypothetical protein BMI91_19555 [Thioclava sediminum]|uniref:Initiator Rep protein WH1 domain-containing protein n=1 Tax=Thioclava sediminum TaxID=1915319 RepID=A0ABX3MS02_9RHOB|nr:replication initiation protein [Thioclava sediminum]OOY22480.1 hypothetical protein BMI91_19555 [Thioclava sediminum]